MKNIKIFLSLVLLTLSLAGCLGGGSGSDSHNLGGVPLMTLSGKLLEAADLNGTLSVTDTETNKKISEQALNFAEDDSGNVIVTSTLIELERQKTYRFIIIFNWQNTAIAYVDVTKVTDNSETTTITFSEDNIYYGPVFGIPENVSPGIIADIAQGILPDLDLDLDGYSNFDELRAGTNPNDANSKPSGPVINNFSSSLSEDGNTLTLTATITSGHGIKETLVNFVGHDHLKYALDEQLIDNLDKTFTYIATINPHYANPGMIKIEFSATDEKFGYKSEVASIDVEIEDGENPGPIIFISNPQEDGIITSKEFTIEIYAYDERDGIKNITISPDASRLNTVDDNKEDYGIKLDATYKSSDLGNGNQSFEIEAINNNLVTTQATLNLVIDEEAKTGSPELTVFYTLTEGGTPYYFEDISLVRGTFLIDFQFTLAEGRDATLIHFATNGDFETDFNENDLLKKTHFSLDTTVVNDGEYNLVFRVIDTAGGNTYITRLITVENNPSITSFKINDETGDTILVSDNLDIQNIISWTVNTTTDIFICPPSGPGCEEPTVTQTINHENTQTTGSIPYAFTQEGEYKIKVQHKTKNLQETNVIFPKSGTIEKSINVRLDYDLDGTPNSEDPCVKDPNNPTEKIDEYDCDADKDGDARTISLKDSTMVMSGVNANDLSGWKVDSAGDFNGDGSDDILVSAPGDNDSSKGKVYLIKGVKTSQQNDPDAYFESIKALDLANSDVTFVGEKFGDQAGYAISRAGDINNDGCSDILIGAPTADNGALNVGKVYLIYGLGVSCYNGQQFNNQTVNLANIGGTIDGAIFIGGVAGEMAGFSVSAGRALVNGIVTPYILIGAPYYDLDADGAHEGMAYMIYADPDPSGKISLGNGTGVDPNNVDRYFTAHSNDHDLETNVGYSVAGIGDAGTGLGMVVSALGYPIGEQTGFTSLITDGTNTYITDASDANFYGQTVGEKSGSWLNYIGSFNNDTLDDIGIGAPAYTNNTGRIYLIYGSSNLSDNTPTNTYLQGEQVNNFVGTSFAGGNINDASGNDMVIGAYGYNNYAGRTYVVFGSSNFSGSGTLSKNGSAAFEINGEKQGDNSGRSVGVGDFNKDGLADVVIGAPYADPNGKSNSGKAYMILSGY